MIKIHDSATVFQKYTRRWLQVRKYKALKQAAITLETACRKRIAIKAMWELKRERAAKLLQRVLHGWVYRKKYLQLREATLCIQSGKKNFEILFFNVEFKFQIYRKKFELTYPRKLSKI